VVLGIGEAVEGGQDDARQVEQRHKGEELPIRVEPQLEEDPSTDLGLGRGRLEDVGVGGRRDLGLLPSLRGLPALGPCQRQLQLRVAGEGREALVDGRGRRHQRVDADGHPPPYLVGRGHHDREVGGVVVQTFLCIVEVIVVASLRDHVEDISGPPNADGMQDEADGAWV